MKQYFIVPKFHCGQCPKVAIDEETNEGLLNYSRKIFLKNHHSMRLRNPEKIVHRALLERMSPLRW
jgi:hypothetical protein